MNLLENTEAPPGVAPQEAREVAPEKRESEPRREATPAPEKPEPKPVARPEVAPVAAAPVTPPTPAKDPSLLKVERILEDNLLDVYLSMPPAARARFKTAGEATALKISALIEQSKIKAKTVLKLILEWLKLIPGVNRFFLEQEAKLKTDKIMLVAADRRKEKENQI